jgi:hypothetical protein
MPFMVDTEATRAFIKSLLGIKVDVPPKDNGTATAQPQPAGTDKLAVSQTTTPQGAQGLQNRQTQQGPQQGPQGASPAGTAAGVPAGGPGPGQLAAQQAAQQQAVLAQSTPQPITPQGGPQGQPQQGRATQSATMSDKVRKFFGSKSPTERKTNLLHGSAASEMSSPHSKNTNQSGGAAQSCRQKGDRSASGKSDDASSNRMRRLLQSTRSKVEDRQRKLRDSLMK